MVIFLLKKTKRNSNKKEVKRKFELMMAKKMSYLKDYARFVKSQSVSITVWVFAKDPSTFNVEEQCKKKDIKIMIVIVGKLT